MDKKGRSYVLGSLLHISTENTNQTVNHSVSTVYSKINFWKKTDFSETLRTDKITWKNLVHLLFLKAFTGCLTKCTILFTSLSLMCQRIRKHIKKMSLEFYILYSILSPKLNNLNTNSWENTTIWIVTKFCLCKKSLNITDNRTLTWEKGKQ